MSNTTANLQRKIHSAEDLQSVVRTMKALSASSIGQYEKAVLALSDYYRTIELGLHACFRKKIVATPKADFSEKNTASTINVIVFGSDQGLVGRFNELLAEYVIKTLSALPGKPQLWVVGERICAQLSETGWPLMKLFTTPNSVKAIAPLVGKIAIATEAKPARDNSSSVYLFYNRPQSKSLYEPAAQRLLPLDAAWHRNLTDMNWPTKNLPEVPCDKLVTLRSLIHEYLFISLFRACAESLSSENASRLAAMERADKNIDELLENLQGSFYRLRQNSIDEELFDVVSGFEALN